MEANIIHKLTLLGGGHGSLCFFLEEILLLKSELEASFLSWEIAMPTPLPLALDSLVDPTLGNVRWMPEVTWDGESMLTT